MPWFLGFLVVAISCAWWFTHWRAARHWRRLEDVLSALAEGRKPDSFVFLNGGRFSQLAHPLENLSKEMDRMREEISREEFNLRHSLQHGRGRHGRGCASHPPARESLVPEAV